MKWHGRAISSTVATSTAAELVAKKISAVRKQRLRLQKLEEHKVRKHPSQTQMRYLWAWLFVWYGVRVPCLLAEKLLMPCFLPWPRP
jgi:hypothetical protein